MLFVNSPILEHVYYIGRISRNIERGSKFSSYKIELRIRVTQNDATLRVSNSKKFI